LIWSRATSRAIRILVRAALDDVLASGYSLTDYCGFITGFIDSNPDYARVLDAGNPGRPAPYDARSPRG